MRRARWLALIALIAVLAWAAAYMAAHPYGDRFALGIWPVPQGTPWSYQLLSGFIPALTAVSLVTLVSGAYHHVNCHEGGCWRIGKHKVSGTPWCNRHHGKARPELTVESLLETLIEHVQALTETLAGRE
jgi:hypothetical protein